MDTAGEPSGELTGPSDVELLAGLRCPDRRRGPRWALLMAVAWAVLGAGQLAAGNRWVGLGWGVVALGQLAVWWSDPAPRVLDVTGDALVVRWSARTQTVTRTAVRDVRIHHTDSYGLTLSLRGGRRLRLAGTASRASLTQAQAAALRRWAGLESRAGLS